MRATVGVSGAVPARGGSGKILGSWNVAGTWGAAAKASRDHRTGRTRNWGSTASSTGTPAPRTSEKRTSHVCFGALGSCLSATCGCFLIVVTFYSGAPGCRFGFPVAANLVYWVQLCWSGCCFGVHGCRFVIPSACLVFMPSDHILKTFGMISGYCSGCWAGRARCLGCCSSAGSNCFDVAGLMSVVFLAVLAMFQAHWCFCC